MPEKNIADLIQAILDKNKGFMTVKRLSESLGLEGRRSLGIKKSDSVKVIRRRIEQSAGDRFIFKMKSRSIYILEPCEPSEFVLGLLSEKKAFDTRLVRTLPFTKAEFVALVNELVDEGKVIVKISEYFTPKIYRADGMKAVQSADVSFDDGEYTRDRFREAFENSDKGRSFVRIFKMRRYLGWPREVFDNMLRELRNSEVIFVHRADPTVLSPDEYDDGFFDEYGHMNGTVTWNE